MTIYTIFYYLNSMVEIGKSKEEVRHLFQTTKFPTGLTLTLASAISSKAAITSFSERWLATRWCWGKYVSGKLSC